MNTKTRTTLAKKIQQADTGTALQIALRGRVLSKVEQDTDQFLFWYDGNQKLIKLGQKESNPERKSYTENVISTAESLSVELLTAIVNRDAGALRRVADFVETWKRFAPIADGKRAGILSLKQILDKRGEKMTIQKLAGLLNRKLAGDTPVIPDTDDGHASLRRLAKKLKFPIAPDAKGQSKKQKTDKRK